jgi:hypothetical protein
MALPVAAVLPALNVSVLVPLVDVGLKDAVTPLGRPLAASDALPLKPPDGVTVTVALAVPP